MCLTSQYIKICPINYQRQDKVTIAPINAKSGYSIQIGLKLRKKKKNSIDSINNIQYIKL